MFNIKHKDRSKYSIISRRKVLYRYEIGVSNNKDVPYRSQGTTHGARGGASGRGDSPCHRRGRLSSFLSFRGSSRWSAVVVVQSAVADPRGTVRRGRSPALAAAAQRRSRQDCTRDSRTAATTAVAGHGIILRRPRGVRRGGAASPTRHLSPRLPPLSVPLPMPLARGAHSHKSARVRAPAASSSERGARRVSHVRTGGVRCRFPVTVVLPYSAVLSRHPERTSLRSRRTRFLRRSSDRRGENVSRLRDEEERGAVSGEHRAIISRERRFLRYTSSCDVAAAEGAPPFSYRQARPIGEFSSTNTSRNTLARSEDFTDNHTEDITDKRTLTDSKLAKMTLHRASSSSSLPSSSSSSSSALRNFGAISTQLSRGSLARALRADRRTATRVAATTAATTCSESVS